jgi:mannose-6-phosphate isomerase
MKTNGSNPEHVYPLLFRPVYKDYIWGGDRILRYFHRSAPAGIYAESWEVADHPDGMSVVVNGPLAGQTLREVLKQFGPQILGQNRGHGPFPLLIKLIDARDRLSVQVHPNDETAKRFGGEAKTEMWYFLDADPGAQVYAGMKQGTNHAKFEEALVTKKFEDLLVAVPVKPGEAVFVPGGRVHAIDAGCLILEIQQNSNTTYRVYDWGRVGADGKPRALHVKEALQVIHWDDTAEPKVKPRRLESVGLNEHWEILSTRYFRLERFELKDSLPLSTEKHRFNALFVSRGSVRIEWGASHEELAMGTSCLVPAALGNYLLTPIGPSAEVLRVTLPEG